MYTQVYIATGFQQANAEMCISTMPREEDNTQLKLSSEQMLARLPLFWLPWRAQAQEAKPSNRAPFGVSGGRAWR